MRAAIYCAIALFLLLGLGAAYLLLSPEESRPEALQNLSVGRRELVLAALILAMIANNGIRVWSRLQGERPTYYVLLAVSWGVVAFLLLIPDSVLSEKARAGAAPIGRTVQVMLGLAAVAGDVLPRPLVGVARGRDQSGGAGEPARGAAARPGQPRAEMGAEPGPGFHEAGRKDRKLATDGHG